jgi:hypothetical protein
MKKQPKEEEVILSYLKQEAIKHFISSPDNELQNQAKEIVVFAHKPHYPELESISKYGPMIVIPMLVAQVLYWAGADGRESVIDLFLEIEKPILKELIEFMGKFATIESSYHARNTAFWVIGERASNGVEDVDTALDFLKTLSRNHISNRSGFYTLDDINHFINHLNKQKHTTFIFSIGDSVKVKGSELLDHLTRPFTGEIGKITHRTAYDDSATHLNDDHWGTKIAYNVADFNKYRVIFAHDAKRYHDVEIFKEYQLEQP